MSERRNIPTKSRGYLPFLGSPLHIMILSSKCSYHGSIVSYASSHSFPEFAGLLRPSQLAGLVGLGFSLTDHSYLSSSDFMLATLLPSASRRSSISMAPVSAVYLSRGMNEGGKGGASACLGPCDYQAAGSLPIRWPAISVIGDVVEGM